MSIIYKIDIKLNFFALNFDPLDLLKKYRSKKNLIKENFLQRYATIFK